MAYDASSAYLQYKFGDRMLVSALSNDLDNFFTSVNWSVWLPPEEWVDVDTGLMIPINGSNGRERESVCV